MKPLNNVITQLDNLTPLHQNPKAQRTHPSCLHISEKRMTSTILAPGGF